MVMARRNLEPVYLATHARSDAMLEQLERRVASVPDASEQVIVS